MDFTSQEVVAEAARLQQGVDFRGQGTQAA